MKNAIRSSWDRRSCYGPLKRFWTIETPEIGQCAITAMILQDTYGGDIVYDAEKDHYWNVLPNGEHLDLTRSQFKDYEPKTFDIVDRKEALELNGSTMFRYAYLREKINTITQYT